MRCSEFLDRYSDFRDGLIADSALLARLRQHLDRCPRCARHHRAVVHGVGLLRSLGEIEPSERFRNRLAERLLAQVGAARRGGPAVPAGPAALGLVVVGLALLLYEGFLAPRPRQPVPRARAVPVAVANSSVPFVSFQVGPAVSAGPLSAPAPGFAVPAQWSPIAP